MKVLIVGCGAVGQVFGLFLQKAGVELGCYDRPTAAEKLKQALEHGGLPLFQVQSRGRDPINHRLENYQVLTDVDECQRFKPDQVWFTVPSPVYYSDWFREFLQQVPSEHVACFTPEGRRAEFFPEGGGKDVVFGGITFMAWQGDLDRGCGQPNTVNFWRPPLGIPLSGDERICREVGQLLKKAGFSFTIGKGGSSRQASVTAGMTAFMAGLELSGWTLGAFRKSPWLKRAARAAHEATLGQFAQPGSFTKTLLGILCSSTVFFLIACLLPLLFPFNIEKYLKFHYQKTREQTIILLNVFTKDSEKRRRPVKNIRLLLDGLFDSK